MKENGLFVVKNNEGKQLIFPDKIKSIHISRGARISSDAALFALENEIDVFFIDKTGMPAGRLWSGKFGSISTIRRKQIDFTVSPAAVDWIKDLIVKKIDNQSALLLSFSNSENEKKHETAVNKIDVYKQKIRDSQSELVNDIAPSLRGWEGAASKVYFSEISDMMPQSMKFSGRSMRPAKDIFNMLLNYGYGMLYGKVESALIKSGLDPYTGVLHREDYNRPAMAFDVIELYRVWIDYVVVNLCIQEVIDEDCYSVATDGGFWLETQGKRILIQSVNDYLSEILNSGGIIRSRAVHIDLYAQDLAQKMFKFKSG
jgi:CRISPR-associated protein Cas1